MGIQLNVGDIVYSPARDIVYLYPQILQTAAERLEDGCFSPLTKWLEAQNVTMEELAQAVRAYCVFMNSAHKEDQKSMEACLKDSGWWECREEAQAAYMAYVGILMTGVFYGGVREATFDKEAKPAVKKLNAAAEEFLRRAIRPRWLLKLNRWKRKLQRTFGRETPAKSISDIP